MQGARQFGRCSHAIPAQASTGDKRFIVDELVRGNYSPAALRDFQEVIADLKTAGLRCCRPGLHGDSDPGETGGFRAANARFNAPAGAGGGAQSSFAQANGGVIAKAGVPVRPGRSKQRPYISRRAGVRAWARGIPRERRQPEVAGGCGCSRPRSKWTSSRRGR